MNYINTKNQSLLNTLIFFFPISFLIGRFFVELSLFVFTLVAICSFKKWSKFLLDKSPIIILLFLFYLTVLVSTINNLEILSKVTDQNLILKSFLNFRFILYIISVWFVLNETKINKNFINPLIFVYIFFLFDGYVQFFSGENLLGYTNSAGRITGIFEDEYIFGSYIQKVLPIILILIFFSFEMNTLKQKSYLFIILLLSTIIILLSGDRAANLLFLFFLILCTIYMSELRKILLINFFISGVVFFCIISLGIGKNVQSLDQRYNPTSEFNAHTLKKENPSPLLKYIPKDHLGHYLVVKEMAKDNLYLGKGIKSFRFMCRGKLGNFYPVEGGVCSTHPHNYYLQSVSSSGVIGLFFLLSIFIYISFKMLLYFIDLFKKKSQHSLVILSTICVFVYFWPLIPTGNFFSNWISGFNCFVLGLFLFISSKFKIGKNE